MNALGLALVIAALATGSAWLVSALTFPAWVALSRRWPGLARKVPLVAALPVVAALTLTLAALIPGDPHLGLPSGCHCDASMPAWSHLCPVHPEKALVLLPAALAVLALLLPGRIRAARRLLDQPRGPRASGSAPVLTDLPRPTALLLGWRRPTIVVDRRLWSALAPGERSVVLAHEQAHIDRRDPLTLMALQALTLAAPRTAATALIRTWLDRAEGRADALAARAVHDPLLVARTLLRCARLGSEERTEALAWTGGTLEHRVRALLADDEQPVSPRPDAGVADLLVLIAVTGACLSGTPWVHHHVEHLLNLSL